MKVLIYETRDGFNPFEYWLRSFGDKLIIQRIVLRLERIKEGNLGDYKSISEGVFELRFNFGGGLRIYFSRINIDTILILLGGNKKSQTQDILKAKKYWKNYEGTERKKK